jgi:hypothetical protein
VRRVFRHLFTLCSALSLLLCVAVCVLWVRSYFRADWVPLIPRVNGVRFDSWQGRLFVVRVRFPEDRPTYLRMDPPVVGTSVFNQNGDPAFRNAIRRLQQTAGIKLLTPPRAVFSSASPANGFGFGYSGEELKPDMGWWTFSIPYWFLALAAAMSPVAWLVRRRKLRGRIARGLCPRCGYDLRASPERCPECGTPAK